MKSAGAAEIRAALLRCRKLRAMERIAPSDARFIQDGLERVLGRISEMSEMNEKGVKEGLDGKASNR